VVVLVQVCVLQRFVTLKIVAYNRTVFEILKSRDFVWADRPCLVWSILRTVHDFGNDYTTLVAHFSDFCDYFCAFLGGL
jgi:hypothetical protein